MPKSTCSHRNAPAKPTRSNSSNGVARPRTPDRARTSAGAATVAPAAVDARTHHAGGTPVASTASDGRPQFIYTMLQARPLLPARPHGARGHLALVLPGRQDRRDRRRTARASQRCCGSWPASTTASAARPGSRPASRVGYLAQEPQLDPAKDVLGNVMDGVGAGARRCSTATTRSWPCGATPTPTTRRSARCRPSSRTRSTPPTRGTSTATSRSPWTRCAARPTTPTSPRCPAASGAGWRCAGCCSSHPDLLLLDEPTNHLDAETVDWLERFLQEYPGTVVAITHDRYFLDNVARWILELDRGRGFPFEGNYSSLARAEAGPAGPGGEAGLGPPAHARSASWSGCGWRPRPARPRARPA